MTIRLGAIATVSLFELAKICDEINENINHAGHELLLAFLNYSLFDIYQRDVEVIFENQLKVSEILMQTSQTVKDTAKKNIKYIEQTKTSYDLPKHNFISKELESKNLSEPDLDLLTLLRQLQ